MPGGPGRHGYGPKHPDSATSFGLTRRETEVLSLVAEGRTNRQIGQTLFISKRTASIHVSHILAKLRAANRGEAVAIAHRLGLHKRRPEIVRGEQGRDAF